MNDFYLIETAEERQKRGERERERGIDEQHGTRVGIQPSNELHQVSAPVRKFIELHVFLSFILTCLLSYTSSLTVLEAEREHSLLARRDKRRNVTHTKQTHSQSHICTVYMLKRHILLYIN